MGAVLLVAIGLIVAGPVIWSIVRGSDRYRGGD
jgi:hypothetical protein